MENIFLLLGIGFAVFMVVSLFKYANFMIDEINKIKKMDKKMQKKTFGTWGKAGESDRKITTKMPKHLFAGKRGSGKTDRR